VFRCCLLMVSAWSCTSSQCDAADHGKCDDAAVLLQARSTSALRSGDGGDAVNSVRESAKNPCASCSHCVAAGNAAPGGATDSTCADCALDHYKWWPCNLDPPGCMCGDPNVPTSAPTPPIEPSGCVRNPDCAVNAWCKDESYVQWCLDNSATCPLPQCLRSDEPSEAPTPATSEPPTMAPSTTTSTMAPTSEPTGTPTVTPTRTPTAQPTVAPTSSPTVAPTRTPIPTVAPTAQTPSPTTSPTQAPTSPPSPDVVPHGNDWFFKDPEDCPQLVVPGPDEDIGTFPFRGLRCTSPYLVAGDLCKADRECGTVELNNVGGYDVYKVAAMPGSPTARPFPCVPPRSIGQCGPCLGSEQCTEGYCCPLKKQCVGVKSCIPPFADCDPAVSSAIAPAGRCNPKMSWSETLDGVTYPTSTSDLGGPRGLWQHFTCTSPVVSPTLAPSEPPVVSPTSRPSTDPVVSPTPVPTTPSPPTTKQPTTAPTGPPSVVQGPGDDNECPPGSRRLPDQASCDAAAAAVGFDGVTSRPEVDSRWPKGCYLNGGILWFNAHELGAGKSSTTLLCESGEPVPAPTKAPTQPTLDPVPTPTKAPTQPTSDGQVSADEWTHFGLLNELRASGATCPDGTVFEPNAVPLKFECRLWRASKLHSEDMAANDYFAHQSQDGRSPWDRAEEQGIGANAENIYAGSPDPYTALYMLKSSNGHCLNFMNPSRKLFAVGYGYNADSRYAHFWTQMFKITEVPLDTSCYPSTRSSSTSGGADQVDPNRLEPNLPPPWFIEDLS